MNTGLQVLTIVAAAGLFASQVAADDETGRRFWDKLYAYERIAHKDYRSRNMSPSVLKRSQDIWELQQKPEFEREFASCASAAKNLSHMVSSTYYASNRARFPAEWHHFSEPYERQRAACLVALGLSDRDYPLPWW